MSAWRQAGVALLLAVLAAGATRAWLVEPRTISSGSMEPTLQVGDRIVIDKLSYRLRQPRAQEIVLFDPPPSSTARAQPMVKRVVGLPGQEVEVSRGQVRVDGVVWEEDYLAEPPDYVWQGEVPRDALFVLGDNRNASADSHVWGFLPLASVRGRVMVRIWPSPHRF